MIDLRPSSDRMAALLAAVTDDQLQAPTPCAPMVLGDLISHVGTFALVFGAMGRKDPPIAPGPADGSTLGPDWRDRIATDLDALAAAWADPASVEGDATAGGVQLPNAEMLRVALDELVVHGWDVAVSSGQAYDPDPDDVRAALDWASGFEAPRDGRGPFGPEVEVVDGAPPLDQLLGVAGRDPGWSATAG